MDGYRSSGALEVQQHISFAGASVRSEARGEVPTGSKTIYYLGPGEEWRTAAHFERVRYAGIYPGIDLVFVTAGDRLEYNFEIAPYADPSAIRIGDERSSFALTPEGDLEVRSGNAVVIERRPLAFQTVGGRIRPIACAYRLIGSHQAELRLGTYDRGVPLFIDPVLNFSTYFGGPGYDSINAAATDAQGNLYVAGETSSGSLTNPSASDALESRRLRRKVQQRRNSSVRGVPGWQRLRFRDEGLLWTPSETSM